MKITLGMLYGRQYAYEAGKESPQRFEITITIVIILLAKEHYTKYELSIVRQRFTTTVLCLFSTATLVSCKHLRLSAR